MPFLPFNTHRQITGNGINSNRKEQDAQKSPCRKVKPANSMEKASVFISWKRAKSGRTGVSEVKKYKRKLSAVITIETALVLPLFFLAVLCLVYRIEVLAVQTNMKAGLRSAGKELAAEAALVPAVSPQRVSEKLIQAVGKEKMDRSLIKDGAAGIDCRKTWMNAADGKLHLNVSYHIKIPVPVFAIPGWKQEESLTVKAWTGYEADGFGGISSEETVYITETGVVYHKDPHCSYLELSIRPVPSGSVAGLRNEYGSKYYP